MNIWDYNFNYNGQAILFNLILFIVSVWKYKSLYLGKIRTKGNYGFIFISLVLFSTWAYAEADFYHYQFHYDMMKHNDIKSLAEPVYYWIAKNLPDNYYLWRLSIWASAALLMILSLKKIGVYASYVGLLMPVFFWHQFSLTRGALGFSLIIFALTYVFDNREKSSIHWIAIAALPLAAFFHTSIAVFLLVLLATIVIPFNTKTVRLSIFIFPLLYGATMLITDKLLELDFLTAGAENLAEHYMEGQRADQNFFGVAFDVLNFSGQLLMLFLSMNYILNKKNNINKTVFVLAKYGYVLVYISFLFYGQVLSSFVSSRFLHASTFPLIVVYSYYMQHHNINGKDRLAMILLGMYAFYELIYPMYKWW